MSRNLLLAACLAGCASAEALEDMPLYLGSEAKKIDDDLVNVFVWMRATGDRTQLKTYADCAVARYALDQDAGFARHLRTNITERGGIWRSDAIYTISVELPPGLKTIDASSFAQSCAEKGIPT